MPTATMAWLKRRSAALPSLALIAAATPLASALRLSTPADGQDLHALRGQRLGQRAADLGILDRHDAVEHLDHRHLGAEVVVEAGELDPDRARADDQQLARHFGRGHRVAIGPDALAVGLGERQLARPRAGGDDDVLGGELGRLAVRGDASACPAPVSLPSPMCTAILLRFIRPVTPWFICAATSRLRATTLREVEARPCRR